MANHLARQLIPYYWQPDRKHHEQDTDFLAQVSSDALWLNSQNFQQAKNYLGQEFSEIVYDGRQGINLDALAVACGCLKAGGKLWLWLNSQPRPDQDSLRWTESNQKIDPHKESNSRENNSVKNSPIFTPQFDQFLQQTLAELSTYQTQYQASPDSIHLAQDKDQYQATAQQQRIIQQILAKQQDIYLLTAKRGRGKSALVGLLANQLLQQGEKIWLTAPNKKATQVLQDYAQEPLQFIAPDQLLQDLQQAPDKFCQDWLLIDEAAMIPLPLLLAFSRHFRYLVYSTTVQSYEGTGRGFILKLLPQLARPFVHFELEQALRFQQNDPVEYFIDRLLLLDAETQLHQHPFNPQAQVQFHSWQQSQQMPLLAQIYGLLMLAHYRTSPLDLRRLLDAPNQKIYLAQAETNLIGVLWLVEEGGLLAEGGQQNNELIQQIIQGSRRPKGNLVAQLLAFQWHLPLACELKSERISRIAIQPNWQHQGIGSQFIQHYCQQSQADYLSVSFGYQTDLLNFWQNNGFQLVYIGEYQESSSGCYNAVALKGLTEQGKQLVEQAKIAFQRNFPCTFHPLAQQFKTQTTVLFDQQDKILLETFAYHHRTLFASLGAIQRFLASNKTLKAPLLQAYLADPTQLKQAQAKQGGERAWLKACRQEIQLLLAKQAN